MAKTKRKAGPVTVIKPDGTRTVRRPGAFVKRPYWMSEAWKRRRRAVLDRDEHRCVVCKRSHGDEDSRLRRGKTVLEVHHTTYERYGHERLEDLVTLCQRCHATEHQWQKRERRAQR